MLKRLCPGADKGWSPQVVGDEDARNYSMTTDAEKLKSEDIEILEGKLTKIIDCHINLMGGWTSLFILLGDLALSRKDNEVVAIMMSAVEFLNQKESKP